MVSHPRQVACTTVVPHLKTRQTFINSRGKPELFLKHSVIHNMFMEEHSSTVSREMHFILTL